MASNPEFLREGSALLDSLYPDRVVIGADEPQTAEVLYTLYRPILEQNFQRRLICRVPRKWARCR